MALHRSVSLPQQYRNGGSVLTKSTSTPIPCVTQPFDSYDDAKVHFHSLQPAEVQSIVMKGFVDSNMPMKIPLADLKKDVFFLTVYNPHTFHASIWGYFDRLLLPKLKIEFNKVLVFRSHCSDAPKAQLQPKTMHQSYALYYKSPSGEATREQIGYALATRYMMYTDKEMDVTVATPYDVAVDHMGYWISLLALFHPNVRHKNQKLKEHWLKCENNIALLRAQRMSTENMVKLIPGCAQVHCLALFQQLYEHETVCYQVPFEYTGKLMATRKCVMFAGNAYVHRLQLYEVMVSVIEQHNKHNIQQLENSTGIDVMIRNENVNGLLMGFLYRFRDTMDGDYKHKKLEHVKLMDTKNQPPCIRLLMSKAYNTHNVKQHLLNSDRMKLGLFLVQQGMDIEDIAHSWEPKMRMVYGEEFFKEFKQMKGTLKWADTKRKSKPVMCAQMVTEGYCPYARGKLNAYVAQQRCGHKYDTVIKNPAHYIEISIQNESKPMNDSVSLQ